MLIFCLVIANLIASSVIEAGTKTSEIKSASFDLYMISLGKSRVKNEALTIAKDYQEIGAGGFIWEQDGYYHIISSAYFNKNDGILVQNSIKNKGIESSLLSISFPAFSIVGNFSDDEERVLNKAVNSFLEYYHALYDIAISYDTSVYNDISAKLAVNSAHGNFSSTLANFKTVFQEESPSTLSDLSDALNKVLEGGKTLCSGLPLTATQTYSSLIKYHYLEILHIFYELSN